MGTHAKTKKNPCGAGRSPIESTWLDQHGNPRFWPVIDGLCAIQATEREISTVMGCHIDTLNEAAKRCHGVTFKEYLEEKRGAGKVAVRRAQYQLAVEGKNPTMLIWLGKQWLDQRDQRFHDVVVERTATQERAKEAAAHAVRKNPRLLDEIFGPAKKADKSVH